MEAEKPTLGKIAALKTVEFLRERAHGADDKDWDEIFALVPDAEPEDYDRLPPSLAL